MTAHFSRKISAAVLAGAALLLLQPGQTQAHPQMAGRWISKAPPNANMSYEFAPGRYLGAGVWRGTFTIFWANNPISCGHYELVMYYGTKGILTLRDGPLDLIDAANIDVGTRIMVLKGVTYSP
jgi:hypothetical protein